jgi:hypothetical protein
METRKEPNMADGNIMTPNPMEERGQQAVVNNVADGAGVPTQIPEPDSGSKQPIVRVVNKYMEGNKVIIVLESNDTDRIMSTEAKNLAYAQRFVYGLTTAGIEALAGVYIPPEEYENAAKEKRNVALWRREFKLTPGI